jgi:hypothetical protein
MIDALGRKDAQALQDVLLKHLNNKRDVVVMQLQAATNQASDQNQKA